MAATQKNQLFDPGFLFTSSDSFSLGCTVSPQYKTSQTETAISVAVAAKLEV